LFIDLTQVLVDDEGGGLLQLHPPPVDHSLCFEEIVGYNGHDPFRLSEVLVLVACSVLVVGNHDGHGVDVSVVFGQVSEHSFEHGVVA